MRGDLNVDQSDAVLIEKLAFIFGYQNLNVYDVVVCECTFNLVLEFNWSVYENVIKMLCYFSLFV